MVPKKSHIKVFFKNGFVKEGIVEEWGEVIKIKSLVDNSYVIIHNPKEDLFLTQVFEDEQEIKKPNAEKIAITEELKPKQYIRDINLRTKSLLELYKIRAEEERRRAREALTTQKISGIKEVQYADTGYIAQSIYSNSAKKNQ